VSALIMAAVGAVGLTAQLIDVARQPTSFGRELNPFYIGVFLGETQVLAGILIVACVAARTLPRRPRFRPRPTPTRSSRPAEPRRRRSGRWRGPPPGGSPLRERAVGVAPQR
jgi:hypothetical protein